MPRRQTRKELAKRESYKINASQHLQPSQVPERMPDYLSLTDPNVPFYDNAPAPSNVRTTHVQHDWQPITNEQLAAVKTQVKERAQLSKNWQGYLAQLLEIEKLDAVDQRALNSYKVNVAKGEAAKRTSNAYMGTQLEKGRLPIAKATALFQQTVQKVDDGIATIEAQFSEIKSDAQQ